MAGHNVSSPIDEARRELTTLKQQLDALYASYQLSLTDIPINFQGEVHKYLCIRLSGFLEQAFFSAVSGYLKATSSEKSANFALSFWKQAPNLNPKAFDKLIEKFGDEWKQSIDSVLDDSKRSQLGTLMKVRNTTAHGGNYSGTLRNVSSYKSLTDEIYNWILREILA